MTKPQPLGAPDASIQVWRNTTDPAVLWRFLKADGVTVGDMADSYELDVYWPSQQVSMKAGVAGVAALTMDRTKGELYWPYTLVDSNRLPLGSKATYELYGITSGKRKFWVGGTVNVGTYSQ